MRRVGTGKRLIPGAVVVAIAVLLAVPRVTGPVRWSGTDALAYQAQSLEIRGDSPVQARHAVMTGHPGRDALATDRIRYPATARKLADPRWRSYSSQFYRRRWVVSALTALGAPVFGERSLLLVSAFGYVLTGLLLFLLLARRFEAGVSVGVTVVFLLWPPLRDNLLVAGTDSWGLALLILALIFGVMALERGGAVLVGWFLTLAVLSVTREDGVVALVTGLWLAVRLRTARTVVLAAGSLAATLPAGLLLGASLTKNLAYVENGYNPPPSTSLSFVLDHYASGLHSTLVNDLEYPSIQGWSAPAALIWYLGLVVMLGGIVALLRRRGPDPYFRLIRGTLLGAVVYIAISVNYTSLRLELVLVPALAVGLALVAQAALRRTRDVTSVDVTSPARMIAECPPR